MSSITKAEQGLRDVEASANQARLDYSDAMNKLEVTSDAIRQIRGE